MKSSRYEVEERRADPSRENHLRAVKQGEDSNTDSPRGFEAGGGTALMYEEETPGWQQAPKGLVGGSQHSASNYLAIS